MNLIRQDYGTRLKSFSDNSIERNDALNIGKLFYLFPHQIQRAIIENKDHFGLAGKVPLIRDENGLIVASTKHIEDIRRSWINSEFLKPIPSYKEENSVGKFIWDFDVYLSNFTISSIDDIRKIHDMICVFLKKYIIWNVRYHDDRDFAKISRFLLEEVLLSSVLACNYLYKYLGSKEEYEITSSFFDMFKRLCEFAGNGNPKLSHSFVNELCKFYDLYRFNKELIHASNDTCNPFVTLFIHGNNMSDEDCENKAKDVTLGIHLYESSGVSHIPENILCDPFFENTSDVSVFTSEFSGKSESDITVFGDSGIFRSLTGNMDKLKSDLLRFNSESVKSYIDKGDNVKINFVIDDQFKMYIQAELDCKILIANIKNNDENNMLTILNYENDNFVLFTTSDNLDTLYGLSINEDTSTKERKLITIDRDEDLTFQFVDNLDE